MADAGRLLDLFDRVVAAAAGAAPPETVEEAALVGRRARARRGYLGETLVVALAGGTGSGKSSLVNALAGEEVAPTGPLRPTTDRPLAWIPANPEPGLVRLLDDIGVEDRVGQDRLPWLAVIDLPDVDSTSFGHRAMVERLLPHIDAVVWVVDPEKYQDRVLHRYLRETVEHAARFRFVLNQRDRIDPADLPAMLDDFAATLRADGIADPVIVATAADPFDGPPDGVEGLVEALSALGDAKEVVTAKLTTDLDGAVARLAAAAGLGGGAPTGFDRRWEHVVGRASVAAAGGLVDGLARLAPAVGAAWGREGVGLGRRPAPPVLEVPLPSTAAGSARAVREIEALVEALAGEVGGEVSAAVEAVGEGVEREVQGALEAAALDRTVVLPEPPAWWRVGAWVRRVALVLAAVTAVWGFDAVRSEAGVALPALALVGCLLALLWVPAAGAAAGRRRAVEAAAAARDGVQEVVRRELDRRVGRPLRAALRVRAGLGAALAEWSLARVGPV